MTNAKLGFGKTFTKTMVTASYADGAWGSLALVPYAPISLDPASSVLHYGQAIFEGLKAYRHGDTVVLFRPDMNAKRFNASAARLAMPEIPEDKFIEAVEILVRAEKGVIPTGEGESLYLRPLMIATEAALGVHPSISYEFILFGSPSGSYFPDGVKPLTLWLETEYVRAAPGGTGEAKCAGNYAASLKAQEKAIQNGCAQVIWLDAANKKYIEEMGGMNLFFVYRKDGAVTLVTPKLTGTILPGITRATILELAKDLGYGAEERQISVEEWKRDLAAGALTEVFACGTAAVVVPIAEVKMADGSLRMEAGAPDSIAMQIREVLMNIQYGRAQDTHGWVRTVS